MKHILIATTALVATAGIAAAEIAVGGSAEIGIVGGDRYATPTNSDGVTQFWTDVEVTFTMTGEADNGLQFGAKIDLDEASNPNGLDDGGATWFLAYGNARLDMGDTDGALDWAMQEVNLAGGSIDDSETAHVGFNGNGGFDGNEDGQVARFTYTFNSFSVALSAELDDTPNEFTSTTAQSITYVPGVVTIPIGVVLPAVLPVTGSSVTLNQPVTSTVKFEGDSDNIYGIGFKYSGDLGGLTLGVGLGYQSQNDFGSITGLSVDTKFANGISAAVNYSVLDYEFSGAEDTTHFGIGFGYSMNNLAIGVNYGAYENLLGIKDLDSSGFGLAATYDLGGGLSAQAGFSSGETKFGGTTVDSDSFSLGLAMSF